MILVDTSAWVDDCLIGALAARNGVPVRHADTDFDVLARHTDVGVHEPAV